ncbi:MAG: hypothetical protein ACFCUQ_16670 [Kiloniellales bacterium]
MHRGLAVGALTAIGAALGALLLSSLAGPVQAQDSARLERHAWAAGTGWAPALGWIEQQLEACHAGSGSYAPEPCDRFISEVLDRIYGIADFRTGDGQGGYLGMSAVLSAVRYGGSGWVQLGHGGDQAAIEKAQDRANAGDAVLAALPTASGGHVALVLPGQTVPSSSWQRSAPNSASLFISNSKRSYIGKPLSFSFGGDDAAQVAFFARSPGSATAVAQGPAGLEASVRPAAQGSVSAEDVADEAAPDDTTTDDPTTADLVAPLENDLAELGADAPPQLAEALAAADQATRADQAAQAATGVYGLWCEAGGLADPALDKVKAVVINGTGGMLSWGHVNRARAYTFEGEFARPIVEIERNGAIVSVSFTDATGQAAPSTAFFVIDGEDRLFESHIFDAKGVLQPKDTILQRCPGREEQTAAGG